MAKRVYISADYDENSGDRNVVDEQLNKWGQDDLHKVDFVDMAKVVSGSVSKNPDCRICDLKKEFNAQINASSIVICVVGDKTASRVAGQACARCNYKQSECYCTPYKDNTNGQKPCKVPSTYDVGPDEDYGCINPLSYLRHEFEQAKKKGKDIIILYNSTRKEVSWLPSYMKEYEDKAMPFWVINKAGDKVGDYSTIKTKLGF